ncbi:ATP-grasp domain-containing protein [Lacipirellula limnantheis]|nr:ATP-grasp domain-containing protein [Lacipirellula limnantheis]
MAESFRLKRLAMVGASVRAAAFSALRAGYDVVTADLFADADLRAHCDATRIEAGYPEALADWLAATECDGWLFTGALENHHELINAMAKLRPLVGCSAGAIRATRNPLLLQPVIQAAGLAFPETIEAGDKLPLDRSWLCKTYRSANGSGVWLLDGVEARERATEAGAYFQRFVGGTSAAAVYLCSRQGSTLLGITHQLVGDAVAGAKPWHYAGSVGPLRISDAVAAQLAKLGELLSERFKLTGIVGVDLVIERDKAWIIEINPRYSASAEVVERVIGVNVVDAHVKACANEPIELPASVRPGRSGGKGEEAATRTHGKLILYAKRDALVDEEFHAWAMSHSSLDPEACRLADIPALGELISAGHPILTAFAAAPATKYDSELKRLVQQVNARLYGEE